MALQQGLMRQDIPSIVTMPVQLPWPHLSNCDLIYAVLMILRSIVDYADTTFLATINAGTISPVPNPIIFNETRYNPGGHYDPQTGIYTVPLDGLYAIAATLRSYPDNDYAVRIVADGSPIVNSRNSDSGGVGYMTTIVSVPLYLTIGQQVWVSPVSLDAAYGSDPLMHKWFSAYLISAN